MWDQHFTFFLHFIFYFCITHTLVFSAYTHIYIYNINLELTETLIFAYRKWWLQSEGGNFLNLRLFSSSTCVRFVAAFMRTIFACLPGNDFSEKRGRTRTRDKLEWERRESWDPKTAVASILSTTDIKFTFTSRITGTILLLTKKINLL